MLPYYQDQYEQSKQSTRIPGSPKVLIVDDNFEFLEELQEMLSHSGCQIEILSDSGRALSVAHAIKPELILLDLKMGPKSGFQVADEIRNSSQIKDVPIIAMTGFYSQKEHILMMKLCGIKTFILKPFSPDNIIAKMEFALGRRKEDHDGLGIEKKDGQNDK